MLQVRLFGLPLVVLNRAPLQFMRRGAIALLIYLVLNRGKHDRQVVAEIIANDTYSGNIRQHLRNVLADLRMLLGDYVLATRTTLQLNEHLPLYVDVHHFRALLHGPQTVAKLRAAVYLCREELGGGFAYPQASLFDEWLERERRQVYQEGCNAYEHLLDWWMSHGRYQEAWETAERLLARDPWNDVGHRAIDHALLALERPQMASHHQQQYRQLVSGDNEPAILPLLPGAKPRSRATPLFADADAEQAAVTFFGQVFRRMGIARAFHLFLGTAQQYLTISQEGDGNEQERCYFR